MKHIELERIGPVQLEEAVLPSGLATEEQVASRSVLQAFDGPGEGVGKTVAVQQLAAQHGRQAERHHRRETHR